MTKPTGFDPNPWYELMVAAEQCANDLEAEIEARYKDTKSYPSMLKKYELDMKTVKRVRTAVENAVK